MLRAIVYPRKAQSQIHQDSVTATAGSTAAAAWLYDVAHLPPRRPAGAWIS